MSAGAELLACLALLTAMTGAPVPQAETGSALELALCSGAQISVDLPGEQHRFATTPCCAKGCQSRKNRRKLDPAQ